MHRTRTRTRARAAINIDEKIVLGRMRTPGGRYVCRLHLLHAGGSGGCIAHGGAAGAGLHCCCLTLRSVPLPREPEAHTQQP